MIPEKALSLAGENAHLVHRPGGRLHVYTGPLTPSGRFVPRSARTVCRTRTRRLEVMDSWDRSSLLLEAADRTLVCGRCSARLNNLRGRAEQPRTRAEFRRLFADLTEADVAVSLELAETPDEVDAAAHLSLVLFDVAGTLVPFRDRGRSWPPLQRLVVDARRRVHGYPESYYSRLDRADAQTAAAREAAITRRQEAKADREARIARLGISNAEPRRPRTPRTRGARA